MGIFRRPRGILPPHICASLENIGFRKFRITLAFKILLKEREQNVLAVVFACIGRELNPAQMIAIQAGPAAVHPRADDERVEDSGIIFINGVEGAERALQIFGVEPSPNCQHRAVNVFHVRRQIARLPVIIVRVVAHLVVKQLTLAFKKLAEIGDRADVEIEIVAVFGAEIELRLILGRQLGIFLRLEEGIKIEIRVEHERAAVVGVISHEKIGHGSLRRSRLQRGMRVNDARRREKSGIGNSPDAGVAVVVGHVLEQPFNGVVEIAGIIDILLRLFVVDVRPHFDERSFRHITSAHILVDENVSRLVEVRRRPKLFAVQVDAIRAHAVRGSIDQKRVGAGRIFRNINGRKQMHAVAHRDSVFVFRIVFLDIELRRIGLALRGEINGERNGDENQK